MQKKLKQIQKLKFPQSNTDFTAMHLCAGLVFWACEVAFFEEYLITENRSITEAVSENQGHKSLSNTFNSVYQKLN